MRRIIGTIVSVLAIAFILYWISQATSIGAPWFFSLFAAVMVIIILTSLIRTWIRG